LDTGGNVSIIWLHGDNVGPYLQGESSPHSLDSQRRTTLTLYVLHAAMHFSFGLGAFVAPMIVGWFIDVHDGDPTWYGCQQLSLRAVRWNDTAHQSDWLVLYPGPSGRSACAWAFCRSGCSTWAAHRDGQAKRRSRAAPRLARRCTPAATLVALPLRWTLVSRNRTTQFIVMATGIFLLVYVGAEVSAGGYLYAYAVVRDLATETSAAFLTSVFWGALTLGTISTSSSRSHCTAHRWWLFAYPVSDCVGTGRLISIPVSVYLSASQILGVLMCGCIASNLFMAVFDESSTVLWIGMDLFPSPFTSLTQPHLRHPPTQAPFCMAFPCPRHSQRPSTWLRPTCP
jgi:hypothetical protein